MSSACVCHTNEWCFYHEMYVPLEKQRDDSEFLYQMEKLKTDMLTMERDELRLEVKKLSAKVIRLQSENEEEDPRPRFKMDANGNLTRIEYDNET